MSELILFTVSTLPVILLGMYIYKKDKNKEPLKLLSKLFIGGILSTFLVLILSDILSFAVPIFSRNIEELNSFELLLECFIHIALVEEICKWLVCYFISYNNEYFDEIYDMIVYTVFVALGFAFFENLLYVYSNGIGVGLLRAVSAVPGHVCDGIFMGYYLGLAKQSSINNRKDLKTKYIILSILVPTLTHGIYDYCLYLGNKYILILLFIFVIFIYIYSVKKIKRMSSITLKMKDK